MKRRPESKIPLRTPEAVRERHDKILLLRDSMTADHCKECGQTILRRRTLKEIAVLVGLRDPGSVSYHLDGLCKCTA